MAESKFIKIEKDEQVARIILDRPKHNVLDIPMMNELNCELEKIAADDMLKCVVITGEGRSFCAGVEVADHKPDNVDAMVSTFNRIFELINVIDIPVIAAVNGACLGGGMEVAIACDIVIASEKAIFGQPEIKLGFFPPYAALRLPELVGVAKAIEIVTTGQNYSAQQSKDLGFVSQVASVEAFPEAVEKTVKQITMASPLIIRLNKRAVKRHIGTSFFQGVDLVSNYFLKTLMKTEDTLEGIASFEEKRKPAWKNK
ncbi:MAG: enoyl-CoA hydratase/isomerase family protein [Proteobacteria bacterium]|nr:enoyl-CoA hydratase/isomerase family protein [Pseudomonadota bacterium]MBU1585791.1 enoyl-CoA hydratase/isomerase family protein [Pseudomonadota bacterium]MBU2454633.1 enoyl-CoA hydratase/isomerase family protein [Pseudomonadota bacterium]MBU2629026.1 enoyl-CoA hydratase/isomerase family protein [Pseudomonadota bacterium]